MATREEVEHWIGRCALGDRKAFAALYGATSAKLFGVILRVLQDRAEAEDVLQEVYVRIWHKAGHYSVNGLSPMSWLITIARNKAIDRLRARKSAGRGEMDEVADLADATPGPEARTIAAAEAARLQACLETLPDGRAEAVRRAYMEGETYAELERFTVPLNTIRTWLRRGLIALRECLTL